MLQEFNFPRWLMLALNIRFKLRNFVETGTYEGRTALLASTLFEVVHTIEIDKHMYNNRAIQETKDCPKITRHLGSSVDVIPKILPSLQDKTLFYLDGHWCGEVPVTGTECPVLQELSLLANRENDIIVVDDARLFDAPVHAPLNQAEWPHIDLVVDAMKGTSNRHVIRFIDILIATPTPLFAIF